MGTTFDIVAKREYHRCCLVDGALITGDDGTITTIACPGSFRFYKNYVNIPMYLILLEKKPYAQRMVPMLFLVLGQETRDS